MTGHELLTTKHGSERAYPADFPPTIPELLHRAVNRFGAQEFVVTANRRLTFADMEVRSRQLARSLIAAGAGKGTRIGMLFPQGPDWIDTFLAATRIGSVVMAFSSFYTPAELRKALRHGDVHLLLVPPTMFDRDMHEFVREAVPGLPDAVPPAIHEPELPFLRTVLFYDGSTDTLPAAGSDALVEAMESQVTPADWVAVVYTSGTTSDPKGVMHTHGAQVRHAANLVNLRSISNTDRFFAASPFFWIGGYTALFTAMHAGATLICQERFEAGSALELIDRERPTQLMGFPIVRQQLIAHPSYGTYDFDGVPFLPPPDAPEINLQLFHNVLGMTETSGPHSIASTEDQTVVLPARLRGSYGPPAPYVEHRIADFETNETLPEDHEGEVCVRGYSVMAGLYKREREDVFDVDGWYHTGDRGFFRDGYLFFTGRASDMIKTAGSNVAPAEVEMALEALPEIRLAMVFGVPDEERGQIVVAGVVPLPDSTVEGDELRKRLRKQLSSYKVPRTIVQLRDDEVPMLPTGKPDRRAIADVVAARVHSGRA